MSVTDLPALNATLNAISTVLLITGYVLIRRGRRQAHRKACMIAALVMSALFLTSYVIYHAQVGSVPFKRTGWIRTVYFAVLIPHVILAAAIVPPILITVSRGLVREVRQAPPHRAMDAAVVAVCFGHRRDRLLDALSDVGGGSSVAGRRLEANDRDSSNDVYARRC